LTPIRHHWFPESGKLIGSLPGVKERQQPGAQFARLGELYFTWRTSDKSKKAVRLTEPGASPKMAVVNNLTSHLVSGLLLV
jgi:hypothetical protein